MGERERESEREREGERSVRARATVMTRRPARRADGVASRWNPRPSNLPWMIGKGNASSHCGEETWGLDMGSIRAGKLRAFQGGINPLGFAYSYREEKGQKRVDDYGGDGKSNGRDGRRRTEVQEVRIVGRANPAKSYVEAVRRTNWDGLNAIKMRVTREEIAGNLQKLEHCLVVSWKSEKEEEDDLERLGSLWANSWGLKGKLGLAKLERGKALLEFEDLSEARRVASSGADCWEEPI
ncbi:hypothetical protein CK203_039127 [Vitis vinifera]|uniref:DUF4283 domain-containing protein n=1 Tax=Vitis vinifera TaxID=29760 RepID=A0A438IFK2_VITVI|nr:hypothetical protein CK203_039127 [Vitis vinifera]